MWKLGGLGTQKGTYGRHVVDDVALEIAGKGIGRPKARGGPPIIAKRLEVENISNGKGGRRFACRCGLKGF